MSDDKSIPAMTLESLFGKTEDSFTYQLSVLVNWASK